MDVLDSALSKAKWRILPFLMVLYVFCFLDRVNIGFAALQMNADLGLSPTVFGFAAGIAFISYFSLEIPSNMILDRVGARRWIARIMVTWGALSCATAFVQGPVSLYVLRFLLGAAEAGFVPGILYYLSTWFPSRERAKTTSLFFSAVAISIALGAPISGLILSLPDIAGLRAWQWMFLLEGVPSFLLGFVCLAYLCERPSDAPWLSRAEATALEADVAREEVGRGHHGVDSYLAALKDYRIWLFGLVNFGISIVIYGVAVWLPQIVKQGLSTDNVTVGFVTAIPWLLAVFGILLMAASSDRFQERHLHAAGGCLFSSLCFAVAALSASPLLVIIAIIGGTVGIWSANGVFWSIPGNILVGRGAAVGLAMITTLGNAAGFLGSYVIGLSKYLSDSYAGGMVMLAFFTLISSVTLLSLRRVTV